MFPFIQVHRPSSDIVKLLQIDNFGLEVNDGNRGFAPAAFEMANFMNKSAKFFGTSSILFAGPINQLAKTPSDDWTDDEKLIIGAALQLLGI